ncbi:MAG: MATE family efflux transporter [Acidobacteria bacterium]|nr:MATE family efflux transporter [Acidobacteriota bacterium]MCA1627112.1 MATE family efflux transporter [Acidobacteriota bacterium]
MDAPDSTVAAPAEEQESLWSAVKESIRGSHRSYTTGPIGRSILLLAIPMVLEMIMESVFAVVDIFWVSHLGTDAAATVGLTESLLTLIYALAIGLSIGAMAMVARRIGEENPEGAARVAVQAIAVALLVSIVIAVVATPFAPQLLALMGGSPWVVEHGSAFTRVMLAGNVTVVMLFMVNAIFRGAGDAAIAMRSLWLANWINIVLGPCLVFGLGPFPKLGIVGAAIATNIGRGTGAIYALSRLWRQGGRFDVRRHHLRLEPSIMWRMIRLSATGTFQVFIGMASWIGLVRIISSFGSDAVAGYTFGIRVILFALLPSWGMANAAATMVGQALGAGNPQRAEQAVWKAGFYNMIFLGIVGLLFIFFAPQIIGFYTSDPNVAQYGVDCLRIVAYGFLFYAYGMVLGQSFNGAGDAWTPTIINLFVFWLWEIPLAYVLAVVLQMGPRGVFIAMTIAFSTLAVVSGAVFRLGRWKRKVV